MKFIKNLINRVSPNWQPFARGPLEVHGRRLVVTYEPKVSHGTWTKEVDRMGNSRILAHVPGEEPYLVNETDLIEKVEPKTANL